MIWKREDAGDVHEAEPERPAEERRGGEQMADNGEVTIVGAGAKLEGTVVSAGSLRIDGQVKGQINADGDVSLSAQSQVEADIRAQNVSVAGRFKGNIVVKGKAHLARGGRIDGNITSKTLVVEEGGVFHGQSIMDGSAASAGQAGSATATASGQRDSQAATTPPAPAGTTDRPQAAKVP